jgi:hypothetical protein
MSIIQYSTKLCGLSLRVDPTKQLPPVGKVSANFCG